MPRGASHLFTRRGNRPFVLLSVAGGEACEMPKSLLWLDARLGTAFDQERGHAFQLLALRLVERAAAVGVLPEGEGSLGLSGHGRITGIQSTSPPGTFPVFGNSSADSDASCPGLKRVPPASRAPPIAAESTLRGV